MLRIQRKISWNLFLLDCTLLLAQWVNSWVSSHYICRKQPLQSIEVTYVNWCIIDLSRGILRFDVICIPVKLSWILWLLNSWSVEWKLIQVILTCGSIGIEHVPHCVKVSWWLTVYRSWVAYLGKEINWSLLLLSWTDCWFCLLWAKEINLIVLNNNWSFILLSWRVYTHCIEHELHCTEIVLTFCAQSLLWSILDFSFEIKNVLWFLLLFNDIQIRIFK